MKKHFFYLAAILILIGVIAFNRCNPTVKTVTKTKYKLDSVRVDSLSKVITYLKSLPPETVRVSIPIPQVDTVVVNGQQLHSYTTNYSDSLLDASWTLQMTGFLKHQQFTYNLKRRPVQQKVITKYRTRYRTKTVVEPQGGFLSIGGDIGYNRSVVDVASIIVRWQAKDGYSYHFRYDPFLGGYYIGLTVPIRIHF